MDQQDWQSQEAAHDFHMHPLLVQKAIILSEFCNFKNLNFSPLIIHIYPTHFSEI